MLPPEAENESIGTKLSGGFTIKDILKRERSFNELFEDRGKHRIEREREDEKDAVIQTIHDDSPNKPTNAYSKYVLQLQEKIQQRVFRKNGQTSSHSGKHLRFSVILNLKIKQYDFSNFNISLSVNCLQNFVIFRISTR